ncbi:Hypothetical predicted protein [Pelobates cultripes]|uniref:Uncharacterized protein n=1 Tax=Pelobates cultripes TaxID=61616 RepID=A0AAD1SVX5_PELCU|nr:Hypothetical predicted protein [Pelobates cultripes]
MAPLQRPAWQPALKTAQKRNSGKQLKREWRGAPQSTPRHRRHHHVSRSCLLEPRSGCHPRAVGKEQSASRSRAIIWNINDPRLRESPELDWARHSHLGTDRCQQRCRSRLSARMAKDLDLPKQVPSLSLKGIG